MAPQDMFIDEEDDTCPLCVEEFDLSDKNFRPCPCGYQVCQFCFNNIKNNMNGLCPACRRPYDEKTIEWKVVTPEEVAQFKANIQKNAKKKADQRQKEAQKREVESLNRKHLSGLRVVQKNLVYVTGLSPTSGKDSLLDTLRGPQYFGQYGEVIKIAVTHKTRPTDGQGLGIYVTFSSKEEASKCIAAVNNSYNGDKLMRAMLGTTKYCSAYLRNETCTNKSCMFLHEPGDNDDSYSRQDLSSINSVNTQRPLPANASSSSRQPPLQHMQPVAAATQPMNREASKDGSDSGDGSALPSSASWANRGVPQRSRRGSHATSGAASSPAVSQAMPATAEVVEDTPEPVQEPEPETSDHALTSETTVHETLQPQRNPTLTELLKAINSPLLSYTLADSVEEIPFPPLFDTNGGAKRRAMREQSQEEARLNIEQESQTDMRLVAEPVEEDEPESGSLQLGGEPEDGGREIPQGFQRRPSTQLPIQRTTNGPGAPGLSNFPRNLSNLSSINGRTLTPQQTALLLNSNQGSSSSFAEQFSPGIGGQLGQGSGLFQQQGHNRQSSRFSFASENPSAVPIKASANPKFMAQQSSMMPHAQGNQFYGSSMPGPPPGLKSTGTPPIGFGQNHGFGGSMGGVSGFNGLPKNNDNEQMIRNILRDRNNVAGGQSHDAGKREFNFPTFLQQYPSTSSTPAPASGLASLYGPQPGAFHDYSQKQKKKGKKHRHANTSSSGGGGLVDLADPSILQARMHNQQQSNAGVGQLFGNQAQDDEESIDDDEAHFSVDALVSDSTSEGFGGPLIPFNASRSSTPSVPPGFAPHPQPQNIRDELPPKSSSGFNPNSSVFTSRNVSNIPRPTTPLTNVSLPEGSQSNVVPATPTSQAKQDVRKLATTAGLSKTIASQASQPALQSEDFPALDSGKGKAPLTPVPSKVLPRPVTTAANRKSSAITPAAVLTPSKGDKRTGILNISTKVPTKATLEEPVNDTSATTAFPPLPPSTPSAASVQSPLSRNAPKTLRIASSMKPETPTAGSATPSSVTSAFPPQFPPSRQPSLASASRHERPGTPTSEMISDNASITSTSMSRANSPPPNRVGSAPVRQTTKSMQKKQRKEAQKEKERAEMEAVASKEEPKVEEIGPIMGRKKKQKKERNFSSAAGGSTPVASRPPSPSPAETTQTPEERKSKHEHFEHTQSQEKQSSVEPEVVKTTRQDVKGKGKAKAQPSAVATANTTPEPAITEVEEEGLPADKPVPTPLSTLQELTASGVIQDPAQLAIFKNPSAGARFQLDTELQSQGQKLTITPEDRTALLAGQPVRKNGDGQTRIMLTPNGDYVRNLNKEEEDRYLALQAHIAEQAEIAGATAFVSTKHNANNGFTLIGGRAVPNGPPSFFPAAIGSIAPLDPVSKIQRDE
ncbi:General negative regulator of transcription subunit, partial [Lachnellula suecica]